MSDRNEILRVLRAFEASGLDYVLADFDRFLRHCARSWKIAPRVYPRGR